MNQLALFTLLLCLSFPIFAQSNRYKVFKEDSNQRATITNTKSLLVYYEKSAWNLSPTDLDSGYIYLRDNNNQSIIEIKLTETQPNSAVFSVDLPIGTLKQDKIQTEIYSAPMTMLEGKNRVDVIKDLVEKKNVKRKPFLLRIMKSKGQIVDVFDEKESAIAAYEKYKSQMGIGDVESESIIEVKNQEKIEKKKIIDTSTLQSLFMANEADLDATNEKNLELREVLKDVEQKRRQKVKDDAKLWTKKQKSENETKGKQLIQTAVQQAKDNNHAGAMDNFYEASNLIPSNEDVYEQYGVSLYNVEKYNQSIVVLDLAQNTPNREAEKLFYIGLNYYTLKNYQKASEYFSKVMALKDKTFGPTAAFYKGSALMELKKYDESKEAFQYVLDNSSNSELDKKAEKFIESAIELKALEEKRSNKHFFSGVLGLMYDSNIILATNDAINTNTVTNESGWRLLLQGGYKYRPYYSDANEIAITVDALGMQSFDNGFGSNDQAEEADPYVVTIGVPWTHRGTLGGKGYFFDLIPGYETIMMDLDGTGKKAIVNSMKLDFNNSLVVNNKWIAKGDYSFSYNDSSILGDETSADSWGGSLKLSSIFVLNKDLSRYLIPEFSYSLNRAKGAIFAYNRLDIAVAYTTAIFESFLWNSRVGYFIANYENNRNDNNYSLSSGISYHINPHWDWGLIGSYTVNDSNTNPYDKYSVLSTFSFNY